MHHGCIAFLEVVLPGASTSTTSGYVGCNMSPGVDVRDQTDSVARTRADNQHLTLLAQ